MNVFLPSNIPSSSTFRSFSNNITSAMSLAVSTAVSTELHTAIEYTEVFAELTPNQKVEIIKILRENGHTVGFLGDGMNDIPAICEADVGISVDTAVDLV